MKNFNVIKALTGADALCLFQQDQQVVLKSKMLGQTKKQ